MFVFFYIILCYTIIVGCDDMKCSKCGSEINENWKYCPYCSNNFRAHRIGFMFFSFLLVFVLIIVLPICYFYRPVDEKYMINVLDML